MLADHRAPEPRRHPDPTPSLEEVDADLGWLHLWALTPLEPSSAGAVFLGHGRRYTATKAVGDGLLLDGGDASALVHRRVDGWTLMHLGF